MALLALVMPICPTSISVPSLEVSFFDAGIIVKEMDCPSRSTTTGNGLPGFFFTRSVISFQVVMRLSPICVTLSPLRRPALAAGDPATTDSTLGARSANDGTNRGAPVASHTVNTIYANNRLKTGPAATMAKRLYSGAWENE